MGLRKFFSSRYCNYSISMDNTLTFSLSCLEDSNGYTCCSWGVLDFVHLSILDRKAPSKALLTTSPHVPSFLCCLARVCLSRTFHPSSTTCKLPTSFEISDSCPKIIHLSITAYKPLLPNVFHVSSVYSSLKCALV